MEIGRGKMGMVGWLVYFTVSPIKYLIIIVTCKLL